jgi:hypothetical protein
MNITTVYLSLFFVLCISVCTLPDVGWWQPKHSGGIFPNNVPTMTALFNYMDLPCPTRFGVSLIYTNLRGIHLLPLPWLLMSSSTPFVS